MIPFKHMNLKELVVEASQLDDDSRASLASMMLKSLPHPKYTVSDEEVSRRIAEAEADPDVMISHTELMANIDRYGD